MIFETTKNWVLFSQLTVFLRNINVTGPFSQSFSSGEKQLEYNQKSYIFCLLVPNYYLAIALGACNFLASERHWQEDSKMI